MSFEHWLCVMVYMAAIEAVIEKRDIPHYDKLSLHVMLVKWGRLLFSVGRRVDGMRAFQEAYDLASANEGTELFQAMALLQLSAFAGERDFHKGAVLAGRVVTLARQSSYVGALFQVGWTFAAIGDFDRAEAVVAEGERLAATYKEDSVDRKEFSLVSIDFHSFLASKRGDCAAGVRLAQALRGTSRETGLHRLELCDAASSDATRRSALDFFEQKLKTIGPSDSRGALVYTTASGEALLALKDWRGAKQRAEQAIEAAVRYDAPIWALENTLVVRAAEAKLGNQEAVARLTARCREMAASIGFDKPVERFNGRQDLARLWWMASSVQ